MSLSAEYEVDAQNAESQAQLIKASRIARSVEELLVLQDPATATITGEQLSLAELAILGQQFRMAQEFYAIDGDSDESRRQHRRVTEGMANNAYDLALSRLVGPIKSGEVDNIVLMLPLRGALAMASVANIDHLRHRLSQLGTEHVTLDIWMQGIKRDGVAQTATAYFQSGIRSDSDHSRTHVLIPDWGMATGATVAVGAQLLREQTGISYERMTAVGMTIAPTARERLETDLPGISIIAGTQARLNEIGYIHQISPVGKSEYVDVTPKDWGDQMWGMRKSDTITATIGHIDEFMREVVAVHQHLFGQVDTAQFQVLRDYYTDKHVYGR